MTTIHISSFPLDRPRTNTYSHFPVCPCDCTTIVASPAEPNSEATNNVAHMHTRRLVTPSQQQQSSIFRIPAPLKRVFDKFPLVQYDENELPLRATKDKSQHVLHVFTTDKDAREGKPSFNPGCLKWQVWTIVNTGA